jgi:hypothetical protein
MLLQAEAGANMGLVEHTEQDSSGPWQLLPQQFQVPRDRGIQDLRFHTAQLQLARQQEQQVRHSATQLPLMEFKFHGALVYCAQHKPNAMK